jgi:glutathione S-transferase
MIEFFQITGSSSFAVRAALEEGGIDYTPHNVHPRQRDLPGFAEASPLKQVPAIRDGDVAVAETAAVLLYLVERFPEANLGPLPGEPGRGELLRWMVYLSNTVHTIHYPIMWPGFLAADESGHDAVRAKGLARFAEVGAHLEKQLTDRQWCCGDRFSVADIYLYMLKGWEAYGSGHLGGAALDAHYARVGARPGVGRARELDDLDERLMRYHPELRAGQPI